MNNYDLEKFDFVEISLVEHLDLFKLTIYCLKF